MCLATVESRIPWLTENGPRELELLFRAIVYHPASPILIADNDGSYREASAGAGKLLGIPREKLIGKQIDDFALPSFKPQVSQLWRAFLDHDEQNGTLPLVAVDGTAVDVAFIAKRNILPVRHMVILQKEEESHRKPPSWI